MLIRVSSTLHIIYGPWIILNWHESWTLQMHWFLHCILPYRYTVFTLNLALLKHWFYTVVSQKHCFCTVLHWFLKIHWFFSKTLFLYYVFNLILHGFWATRFSFGPKSALLEVLLYHTKFAHCAIKYSFKKFVHCACDSCVRS